MPNTCASPPAPGAMVMTGARRGAQPSSTAADLARHDRSKEACRSTCSGSSTNSACASNGGGGLLQVQRKRAPPPRFPADGGTGGRGGAGRSPWTVACNWRRCLGRVPCSSGRLPPVTRRGWARAGRGCPPGHGSLGGMQAGAPPAFKFAPSHQPCCALPACRLRGSRAGDWRAGLQPRCSRRDRCGPFRLRDSWQ